MDLGYKIKSRIHMLCTYLEITCLNKIKKQELDS